MRRLVTALTVVVLFSYSVSRLHAHTAPVPAGAAVQSQTATAPALQGTVTDPDHRIIVGAVVLVRNEATGQTRTVTTDGSGHFSIDGLAAGTYGVEIAAKGMATERRTGVVLKVGDIPNLQISLRVAPLSENVEVVAEASARTAPSLPSLTARSAESHVSEEFVRNYTTPAADFSQVLAPVPGMFSYSSNGPGLSDTKTFFRGFKDGQYNIGFDGIPFYDTNDPTHHSWVFFPTQFLGGAVVDRSPGSAAAIGPTTFGGSVNLQSRNLSDQAHLVGTASYGSFGTQLLGGEFESGVRGRSKLQFNTHDMRSDGYQTFNHQQRDATSIKYQFAASDRTVLTGFTSYLRMVSNTPDWKDPLRSQITQFGDNYLMSEDPTQANYYGYEHYHVTTDFSYLGYRSNLGHGWSVDDKVYLYGYHNHEHFNAQTGTITTTSGTNKLNAYRTVGNILPITQTSRLGVLRTGLWSQFSITNRYQTPEDPKTLIDAALPNFHETFNTTSVQPYAEYEWHPMGMERLHITPGVKYSRYTQDFVQFADNGKTVGSLGGAASISHTATYATWLPSFDVHYLVAQRTSAYVQFAEGDAIPPTKVFDTTGAAVGVLPKPTRTQTYQVGTVTQSGRLTYGFDVFHTHFDNTYSSAPNLETGLVDFFSGGASISKGAELETNVAIGQGLSVFVNATALRARFADTGLLVQNSPKATGAVGVNFTRAAFSANVFVKHAAAMFNDNGSVHEAIPIDAVTLSNASVAFRMDRAPVVDRALTLRFNVTNLMDAHNIIGVAPSNKKVNTPSPTDQVTLLAGRSASVTLTFDLLKR